MMTKSNLMRTTIIGIIVVALSALPMYLMSSQFFLAEFGAEDERWLAFSSGKVVGMLFFVGFFVLMKSAIDQRVFFYKKQFLLACKSAVFVRLAFVAFFLVVYAQHDFDVTAFDGNSFVSMLPLFEIAPSLVIVPFLDFFDISLGIFDQKVFLFSLFVTLLVGLGQLVAIGGLTLILWGGLYLGSKIFKKKESLCN